MPKKKNKAGQDQEYVPSGNGDASGEYADDGGSNRHFTSFKKPDETATESSTETVADTSSSKSDENKPVDPNNKEASDLIAMMRKNTRYSELEQREKIGYLSNDEKTLLKHYRETEYILDKIANSSAPVETANKIVIDSIDFMKSMRQKRDNEEMTPEEIDAYEAAVSRIETAKTYLENVGQPFSEKAQYKKERVYRELNKSGIYENRPEGFKREFNGMLEAADPESMSIIGEVFGKRVPPKYTNDGSTGSFYRPSSNTINLSDTCLEDSYAEAGHTYFHETGHYINDSMSITENRGWMTTSVALSESRTFGDDGLSLRETIQSEMSGFTAAKIPQSIRKDKEKFINDVAKQYGFKYNEYERLKDECKKTFDSEEYEKIRAEIQNNWENEEYPSKAAANAALKQAIDNWKKNGSFKELWGKLEEQKAVIAPLESQWYKKTGIYVVSDAWSSKSDFGFGLGHQRSYYKTTGWNARGEENLGDEFFANMFSAVATKNTTAIECVKRYMPRSYEKFMLIYNYLKEKSAK